MKKFIIHIFSETFDEDFMKVIEVREKFKATFQTDKEFNEIENRFYELIGEGMAVSSDCSDSMAYFRINLIGDRDISKLQDYLCEFEQVDLEPDFILDFSNFDYSEFIQIDTGDINLDNDVKAKIKEYLIKEKIDFKILRGNEIYERGVSSCWETYLIAVGAGLSIEIIKGLYKLIKDKHFDKDNIKSVSIQRSVKNFLINEYNLKPTDIYLSRFFKRYKSEIVELTYKSKKSRFYIETNNKGEIIKAKKSDFKKTK